MGTTVKINADDEIILYLTYKYYALFITFTYFSLLSLFLIPSSFFYSLYYTPFYVGIILHHTHIMRGKTIRCSLPVFVLIIIAALDSADKALLGASFPMLEKALGLHGE